MHLERRPANGMSFEDEEFLAHFSDDERKEVLKKVCALITSITDTDSSPGRCKIRTMILYSITNVPLSSIQWRLVPMLVLLYLVAYIDKTNIGECLSTIKVFEF